MPSKVLDLGKPNKKQDLFLKAKKRHIGYGGARGGGKSWGVRTKAILLAFQYPGIRLCIARKTYPELIANHINILREQLFGIVRYNDKDKIMRFPNGSTLTFRYYQNDKDGDTWQGQEFDVLFLDEAGLFREEHIKKMIACVRGANSFPKRVYYTMNPGGVSHGYLKRLFIDRRYEEGENPDDYEFIQALVTDNTALMDADPEYVRQLEMLPPKLREAWLHGSWDVFDGVFFEDFVDNPDGYFTRQWSHVIEPFKIPDYWTIYRSYDYGYAKPFSVGYWAVDQKDTVYRISEIYGCTKTSNEGVKWDALTQAVKIKEHEEGHPLLKGKHIQGIADPAIFAADGGESVADIMRKAGVYFYPGDNSRIAGWMQFHYRMAFNPEGYPRMYVFNTCKAFIRTIPLMQYSQTHAEDLDTDMEDHVADESRYFLMSRPVKPLIKELHESVGFDPLNMAKRDTDKHENIYKYNL